jgi:alkylation response protein AidB-like acyl-CoA dehydrogenase
MDLDLSFEQDMLRTASQDFFERQCDLETVSELISTDAGYSADMWQQMAELGWHGLLVPEDHGGIGWSMLHMAVLAMEIGAAACPGPFFTSSIFSTLLLVEAKDENWQSALLPDMAAGERIATVACCGDTHHFQADGVPFTARREADGWVLDGRALFVPYAHIADTLIVAARADDDTISLFVIDQDHDGMSVDGLNSIASDKLCAVTLDGVQLSSDSMLGTPGEGWAILETAMKKAAVAKSAEMVGGGRAAMEMAVRHARMREQFGHPIGSFQAVQHHCANMLTYLESSTLITWKTAWLVAENKECDEELAICKGWTSEAYRRLVALAHQVMGGVGFIEETGLHLYFRHAQASELAFGGATHHREQLAQVMGL